MIAKKKFIRYYDISSYINLTLNKIIYIIM